MYRIFIHWMHFIVTNYIYGQINIKFIHNVSELQISETKYYRKNNGKKIYFLFNKYRITYNSLFYIKFCEKASRSFFSVFIFYFSIIIFYIHRVILGNTEHAFMQRASMHAFANHFTHLRLFRTTPLASTSSQHCYVEIFNINFHYTSFILNIKKL